MLVLQIRGYWNYANKRRGVVNETKTGHFHFDGFRENEMMYGLTFYQAAATKCMIITHAMHETY